MSTSAYTAAAGPQSMAHGPTMHSQMTHGQYADAHPPAPSHVPHSSVSSAASASSYYPAYHTHAGLPTGMPAYQSMQMPNYASYMNAGMPHVSSSAAMSSHIMQPSNPSVPSLVTNSTPASNGSAAESSHPMDTTGQQAPPGVKPRVTATLWEDEGSLCFQVEANGICVARREDNHMINGTKLLNVAGMTRGRRDGILKSEKTRHVVKIGPMHLKGVWIPFERALEFANKEKITEKLYPLFVHQIGQLLYHPGSSRPSVTGTALATTDRADRPEINSEYLRSQQSSQGTSLHQHHHSMSGSMSAAGGQSGQPASANASSRPSMDRAHTFAAPPSGISDSTSFTQGAWPPSSSGALSHPLHIDTGINGTRSVPSTPANPVSSPPSNGMTSMSGYQTGATYDSRYSHSAHPSFSSNYGISRFSQQLQSSPGGKHDMGPPAARIGPEGEEGKYMSSHEQAASSEVGEGDHENDYTHSSGPYSQHRGGYAYGGQTQTPVSADAHDPTASPQKGSGRATPRTAASYNAYQQPQGQLPSSNLYNAMSGDPRALPNGDMYHSGYPTQAYASPTTMPSSNKRGYEADESEQNYAKRQRTHDDSSRPMIHKR